MDNPSQKPRPFSALPSHMQNGATHQIQQSSPLRGDKTHVNSKEREKLTASIKSSSGRRQPLALESEHLPLDGNSQGGEHDAHRKEGEISNEASRDPTAGIPVSRPASPYTQNPPVDFDGLSWPSECSDNLRRHDTQELTH